MQSTIEYDIEDLRFFYLDFIFWKITTQNGQLSLGSAQSYERLMRIASTGFFKAALIVVVWALSHHLCAGVRHLLMDIGVGSRLATARRSAWSVSIGAVVMAFLAAGAVL